MNEEDELRKNSELVLEGKVLVGSRASELIVKSEDSRVVDWKAEDKLGFLVLEIVIEKSLSERLLDAVVEIGELYIE